MSDASLAFGPPLALRTDHETLLIGRPGAIMTRLAGGNRASGAPGVAASLKLRAALARPGGAHMLREILAQLGLGGVAPPRDPEALLDATVRAIGRGELVMVVLVHRTPPLQAPALQFEPDLEMSRQPLPAQAAESVWSTRAKLAEVLRRAFTSQRLGPELKRALAAMLEPMALATMALALAMLISAHAAGVGEAADAILAAYVYATAGWAGLVALFRFVAVLIDVPAAADSATLDTLADRMAAELVVLGVSILTIVVVWASRLRAGGGRPGGGGGDVVEDASPPASRRPIERRPDTSVTPRPDLPPMSGGRSGQRVPDLTGPPNSAIRGNGGDRIFITDHDGNVIVDVTRDRAKPVIPGQGFGPKRAPTPQEIDLLDKLGR